MNSYGKLIAERVSIVAEKKHAYHFLAERHLQALWFEQKYFKGLKTTCGKLIEVLSPGIWNLEAGPDFRKAHIRIEQQDYFGDVEIHLVDESWQQHHHHEDARYDQVILHVSFWQPHQHKMLSTSCGKHFFQAYLENFLSVPLARLPQLLDLDLYPYKKFVGSGSCAHELFTNLSSDAITLFFEKAANWRLHRKRQFITERIADPTDYVGAGMAMALGYKNNSEPFLELFLEMKQHVFVSEEAALAWLLLKCGFFSEYFSQKWGKSFYYKALQALSPSAEEGKVKLHLHQIRPLNHPIRRLVVLAKLQTDKTLSDLLSRVYKEWSLQWSSCFKQGKWKKLLELFMSWLPSYTDSYWNCHYLFEEKTREQLLPLLGDNLKREIVINVFLPFIEADVEQRGQPDEIAGFQHLYRSLSPSKASKSKYLVHRFFGNSQKGNLLNNAYAEQGAYQLHYDFCSHFEASCEGCPFVERYNKLISIGQN